MTTRLTISGTDYDYLTDHLVVNAGDSDGDVYDFVDGTRLVDVRWVRLTVELVGVFEQVAGPDLSALGLWRVLVAAGSGTLTPNLSAPSTTLPVTATLTPPRPYSVSKAIQDRRQSLRLLANKRYAPSDPFLDDIEALTLPL